MVNVHFYRNFETLEVNQDAQMTLLDEPIKDYNVVGFIHRHDLPDFSAPRSYKFGDIKTFQPVSAAYKAQFEEDTDDGVSDDEKEQDETPEENTDEGIDTPAEEEAQDEGEVNDDGAMQTTASLMTLGLASIYALLA